MDWINALTIFIAVSFGIATIVLSIKLAKKQKPIWCYRTRHMIGLDVKDPPELKLVFGTREVKDVYNTEIIFANLGNDVINRSDIARSIGWNFGDSEILKEPLVKKNREAINLSVREVKEYEYNIVELDFDWLGYLDGAIIEVWHDREIPVNLTGEFKNVKIKKIAPITISSSDIREAIVSTVFSLILTIFMWLEIYKEFTNYEKDFGFLALTIIFTVMTLYIFKRMLPRLYRYFTYPNWAKFSE